MKILDLFAGIGGFSLAAHWMGWETVAFVEWDKFAQKVLAKNFPNVPIYGDIREFEGTKYVGAIDIICGGFPCQPFSQAGKRKGADDDRYLWPEMLRIISEVRPRFVIGENVAGILSMDDGKVFEQICTSLENEGYTVQAFNIPAISQGAPHRRERIWIVTHARHSEPQGRHKTKERHKHTNRRESRCEPTSQGSIITNSTCIGRCEGRGWAEWSHKDIRQSYQVTANANGQGLQRDICGQLGSIQKEVFTPLGCELGRGIATAKQWESHWYEVATSLCRVDDGVPAWVDSHRTRRLKALGNAVVPQLVFELFQAIQQSELF